MKDDDVIVFSRSTNNHIHVLDIFHVENYLEGHEYYKRLYPDDLIVSRYYSDFKEDFRGFFK